MLADGLPRKPRRSVSQQSGRHFYERDEGLSVAAVDYDNDGWQDLFVANDSMRAYLYHNARDGTFKEVGLASGMAVTEEGAEMAAMCLSFGDYNNNGMLGLYISDFQEAGDHLWRNEGNGFFSEVSHPSGITDITRKFLSFGGGFFDYDNDGWLDLFIANGHVYPSIEKTNPGSHYKQINLLLHNERNGRFANVTARAAASGNAFSVPHLGRGAAFADFFNDGHVDIVVGNNDDPPSLLRNNGGGSNHWVSFKLIGTQSNRDAIDWLEKQLRSFGYSSVERHRFMSSSGPLALADVDGEHHEQWVDLGEPLLQVLAVALDTHTEGPGVHPVRADADGPAAAAGAERHHLVERVEQQGPLRRPD